MRSFLVFYIAAAVLCISCGRPKIDHKAIADTASVAGAALADSAGVLVAGLPVKFDSTDVLLFTVGKVEVSSRGHYGILKSDQLSPQTPGYGTGDDLWGNFVNIVFEEKDTARKLTDRRVRIREIQFLRTIFQETGAGYILYIVYDQDTNGDRQLDEADLRTLYISKVDGTGFRKLVHDLHEYYDHAVVKHESKLYFRTLEDANKDGELSKDDRFHYYRVDFSGDGYSLTEYDPLKVFK